MNINDSYRVLPDGRRVIVNENEEPVFEVRDMIFHGRDCAANGRTQDLCECPFCHTQTWAYSWSLAGSGKNCPTCKAHMTPNLASKKIKA